MKNAYLLYKGLTSFYKLKVENKGLEIHRVTDKTGCLIHDKTECLVLNYRPAALYWDELNYDFFSIPIVTLKPEDNFIDKCVEFINQTLNEAYTNKLTYYGPFYTDADNSTQKIHLFSYEVDNLSNYIYNPKIDSESLSDLYRISLDNIYSTDLKTSFILTKLDER